MALLADDRSSPVFEQGRRDRVGPGRHEQSGSLVPLDGNLADEVVEAQFR